MRLVGVARETLDLPSYLSNDTFNCLRERGS